MKLENHVVRFSHYRDPENIPASIMSRTSGEVPVAGATVCAIFDRKAVEEGSGQPEPFVGIAICLESDHFCKDAGRKKALKRALEASSIDKEERSLFWEEYRTSTLNPRWSNVRN